MKAFGVLLLAACVLSAYAVKIQPRMIVLASSAGSGASSSSSVASGEAACANAYNQAQQYTNQQVTQQTTACLHVTVVVDPTNPETLNQVAIVRSNLTSLQTNLASCLSITDNLEFVTCVANGNDVNQHLLNNANENAQNAEGQLNNSGEQSTGGQKNCVSHVLSHAKTNLTNAANNYNKCLESVLNNPILQ